MIEPIAIIGLIGSIASIIGIAIAAPSTRSKVIHVIYGFTIAVIVGGAVLYSQEREKERLVAVAGLEVANAELEQLRSIQRGAAQIAREHNRFESDAGRNRGFILAAFSFLEAHKERFPEAYEIAKTLVVNGIRITESAGSVGTIGFYDEQKRMKDGAATMHGLLKGIAAGQSET